MTEAGFQIRPGEHPIVPIQLGDARLAHGMAAGLLEEGIYVVGFSYPVVPKGQAAFMGVYCALTTAFAESPDKLGENMREVRPHFIVGVPRVFEKVHAKILAGVESGSWVRRKMFGWAMSVGREVSRLRSAGRRVSRAIEFERKAAHWLVFSTLHESLGGRLRFAVCGGAPLSAELAAFFHATGLLILEGYGLTESCPVLAFNRVDQFRFGSAGCGVPGVELKLAADGEILGPRSQHHYPGLFQATRCHRRDVRNRRLAAHGRHRPDRSGRVSLHHGPGKGPDHHLWWDQHRPPRPSRTS
jgi:hypothetical protein